MNLLPKSKEEFSQQDYWDSFFKKRGTQAFEWYGEYPELCGHLHKYVKTKDDILIAGCGNSTLGNDLYDIGHRNITSIDISQVAIRQMNNLNQKTRPEMKFIQMDALDMSFSDNSFSAIIDKGTLDALMPNDTQETVDKINTYFKEILRVLKVTGRYICISLLQKHILNILTNYFTMNNCMFRVIKCHEAGELSMPVFMIICTKCVKLPMKILELNIGDSMQRMGTEKELIDQVVEVQDAAFICSGLRNTSIELNEGTISLDLFKAGEKVPRYTVAVVDIPPQRKFRPYAAFIVPQGRESGWLFSTKEGCKNLATMSQCNRLAVVTFHRGQTYESLSTVKLELEECVKNLAPSMVGNEKIPFLSLDSEIGSRTVRHNGKSNYSGEYVVEDVDVDGTKYRRLYYLSSQFVIQSEAKLKPDRKLKGKEIIDLAYLTCEHHIYMCRGVHMAISKSEQSKVAIIGLGGGGLCSFLRKFLPKADLTAVDIDEDMLSIATKWFGLKLDDKMKVNIVDGLEFLKNSKKQKNLYKAILFDVDSKDNTVGMSCPPKEFLTEETLNDVCSCLDKSGLFIANIVLRDATLRPDIVKSLSNMFGTVASYKLENDLNEIFLCSLDKMKKMIFEDMYNQAKIQLNHYFVKNKNKDLASEEAEKCLSVLTNNE